MSRTLATSVVVGGSVYRAGTTPPAEVAGKITNPDCWVEVGESPTPDPAPATPPETDAPGATGDGDAGGAPATTDAESAPEGEPARNATTEAWRAHATALGQEPPEGAKREAIIDALVDAGLVKP